MRAVLIHTELLLRCILWTIRSEPLEKPGGIVKAVVGSDGTCWVTEFEILITQGSVNFQFSTRTKK